MSDDHSTDRDPTPEIPRLPAPPAVMRGLRPRRVPPTDALPAAPATRPLTAGSPDPGVRTAEDTFEEIAMTNTQDIEDRLYPMLRADNAEVLIHPWDRKYGALLVGGQGTGKTSALLSFYLNDLGDPDAAPIVIDPKSELSRICLRITPRDCGKRVWFLDLGHPAFGMSPLRLIGDRPLAIEAAQIAENIVAALLDINENQIYQSSRRYLYHAVIGAIAIAHREGRRAKLEDVYTLLRPAKDEFRAQVAEACADQADLDQTAEFFRSELPDDLRMATSRVAERLDAPRNKISGLTGVPPLRTILQPPHRHSAAGDHRGARRPDRRRQHGRDRHREQQGLHAVHPAHAPRPAATPGPPPRVTNARGCRCWSTRRTTSPAARTSSTRSPPTAPPASNPRSACSTSRSSAPPQSTSRRSSRACSTSSRAGSCSGWATPRTPRKPTRIAMAVYSTMIRDDPDSRARLRVTPEQLLNFPNYFCLASWIANGTRAPAFTGQTYPLPDSDDQWADHHLAEQAERVGPYPEQLDSTLDAHAADVEPDSARRIGSQAASRAGVHRRALRTEGRRQAPRSALGRGGAELVHPRGRGERAVRPLARHEPNDARERRRADRKRGRTMKPAPPTPRTGMHERSDGHGDREPRREVRVDYEPPPPPPNLADSPVRRIVGRRVPGPPPGQHDAPAPDSLRELAFLDRINEIGPADQLDGAASLPRLYDEDYAILALLDRAGLAPRTLIGRAAAARTRARRRVIDRLTKLYRHGLIAQHPVGIRQHTPQRRQTAAAVLAHPPRPRGRADPRAAGDLPQARMAGDRTGPRRCASRTTCTRSRWAIELHRLVGDVATDHWRTPRYATGRYPVPQAGSAATATRSPSTRSPSPTARRSSTSS